MFPIRRPVWTDICVSQADCVLVLCTSQGPPAPSEVEKALFRLAPGGGEEGARVELLLVHPKGGGAPCGTARWRELRPYVRRHHHVQVINQH
jgi:lysophospholipid hydrolase